MQLREIFDNARTSRAKGFFADGCLLTDLSENASMLDEMDCFLVAAGGPVAGLESLLGQLRPIVISSSAEAVLEAIASSVSRVYLGFPAADPSCTVAAEQPGTAPHAAVCLPPQPPAPPVNK